jgi:hypothetical protein
MQYLHWFTNFEQMLYLKLSLYSSAFVSRLSYKFKAQLSGSCCVVALSLRRPELFQWNSCLLLAALVI